MSASVGLRVAGRAFDSRPEPRLPADGVAFDFVLPTRDLLVPMHARFGPDQRLGLAVDAVVSVPPSLFDALTSRRWPGRRTLLRRASMKTPP